MKSESTIAKINMELIRAFAMLDAWFDELLGHGNRSEAIRVAAHILNGNHHLLRIIANCFEHVLDDSKALEGEHDEELSIDCLRETLRKQLYFCLCVLDDLEANGRINEKEIEILFSIAQHICFQLEEVRNRYQTWKIEKVPGKSVTCFEHL